MTSMSSHRPGKTDAKVFTPEQANATLPLVRAIVGDVVRVSREVTERRQRLSVLLYGRQESARDPYHEELAQIEQELEKDRQRLKGFVRELEDLGVEPKSVSDGVVDFPGVLDGRRVLLCWKLGEPEIGHWHEVDDDARARRPLKAEMCGTEASCDGADGLA